VRGWDCASLRTLVVSDAQVDRGEMSPMKLCKVNRVHPQQVKLRIGKLLSAAGHGQMSTAVTVTFRFEMRVDDALLHRGKSGVNETVRVNLHTWLGLGLGVLG